MTTNTLAFNGIVLGEVDQTSAYGDTWTAAGAEPRNGELQIGGSMYVTHVCHTEREGGVGGVGGLTCARGPNVPTCH